MQAQTQRELEPLIGLKLSIARHNALIVFHFGNIQRVEGGSVGEYALHIQCPWRIDSPAGIVTGSNDLRQWAFAEHAPFDWPYEDGNSLQDVRLAELFEGYDATTRSYVNVTDRLVVESVESSPSGDASLSLSGGYRLAIFPTSRYGESWRLFKPGDTSSHYVVGERFSPQLAELALSSENGVLSLVSHHQAAVYYELGKSLKAQDDLAGAAAHLSRAIDINPAFAAAYAERAGVYSSQGKLELALADYDEAIRLSAEHHREYDFVYCLRGNLKIDLDDLDGAILDLSHAISLAPRGSHAYLFRASARYLNGDSSGAIEDYSQAIRLRPSDADAYDSRGDIYRQEGQLEQAIADFTEAIRLNPAEWLYLYHRGLAWAAKGDSNLAIRDYQQALDVWPDGDPDDTKREVLNYIAVHKELQ